jgi:hypothetical protein
VSYRAAFFLHVSEEVDQCLTMQVFSDTLRDVSTYVCTVPVSISAMDLFQVPSL